jgi:hypothetical protein
MLILLVDDIYWDVAAGEDYLEAFSSLRKFLVTKYMIYYFKRRAKREVALNLFLSRT